MRRKPSLPCLFALAVTLLCASSSSWLLLLTSHRTLHSLLSGINTAMGNNRIRRSCDPRTATLRVYMYDLPPEFHFGLMGWNGSGSRGASVWPDLSSPPPEYPGGLNLQHSIEYWLTLDLLSPLAARAAPCVAVRVDDPGNADVAFVPFFSSLSFNRHSKARPPAKRSTDQILQERLVAFLAGREEWRRFGGADHVVVAHHPNSMLEARTKLWPCVLVLADFGRYSPWVANVDKDVVAPYRHMVEGFAGADPAGFERRPTLLYFQGAIYRMDGGTIRQELFYLLRGEKGVHFAFGTYQGGGVAQATRGMRVSRFCLHIAGDTPSSSRLFDAIASHCVPVIVSDGIELPFEDVIDYSEFCVFVRSADALRRGFLMRRIRAVTAAEWARMWEGLKRVDGFFEFGYPSREDDAVQMIWRAVARKVPAIRLKRNRSRRFARVDEDGPRVAPSFPVKSGLVLH